MSRLRIFAVRLLNLFRRGPLERELDAELQAYLELDIDQNIRRGMAPEEARRTALARLGGLEMTPIKEQCRDVHRFRALDDLWRDLQFGFRRLHARPVLAVVAVAVLAIGIGANTAIFALLDALLLRPLPGPDPHRLAVVFTSDSSSGRPSANSYPDFLDIRESTGDVFEHLTAASLSPVGVRIGGELRVMSAQIVEPNYFDTMGLRPVHGRAFEAAEASPVAVIGNGVWLSEFGGDPSVLGRAIAVNGLTFTVVGVAPVELGGQFGGTQGLLRVDVWLPAAFEQSLLGQDHARQELRGARAYDIVGRLRDGVGIDEARTRLDVVGRRLHQSYPEVWTRLSGQPRALTIRAANEARLPAIAFGPLAVLTGLVGTLLLIVCANISGLLLADASVRRREMSIRRALGASRFRLVRQVAVESLGLGLVAGGLGVAAASVAISFVTLLVPDLPLPLPLQLNIEPSWRLLAAALVVSSGVGLLVGFLPALYATRARPRLGAFSQTRLRNTLTAMQATAAVFLLIIAGAFARSIVAAYAVPLGYDSGELALVTVDLEAAGYSEDRGRAYLRQVFEQVPTAEASEAPFLSLQAQSRRGISVDGYQPRAGEEMSVHANVVSPGYVRLMGVPLLRGRDLEPGERNAVLVNRAFAERFWPGQNAVGRRLRRPTREELLRQMRGDSAPVAGTPWSTVVGVVDDAHFVSFREDAVPVLFQSMENVYSPQVTFHIRGVSAEAAREGIGRIDPGVPIANVATMADMVDTALLPAWIAAVVSGFVGAGGLLLACIGLFGTLSYVVALRAPEIGLRVALGARPLQIIRLVAGSASVKLVTVGVVVGAGLGSGVSPLLQSQFSRAQGMDPLALAGVAACLALVASVAVGLPVARALRIDPAEVLRVEE